jgi:squalene-hopene/tetraprenyl-beta-curcumene cyclase
MGKSGLYYYFTTFSKALAVLEIDRVRTADGKVHDWRKDLIETLVAAQNPNGSWLNDDKRWMEGDARLSTAYALLALASAMK